MIFFLLAKSENPKSAIEFGERIYPAFSNNLWLNYCLGLHYSNEGAFETAEKFLLKCIQLHSVRHLRQEKDNFGPIAFRYVIN